jgi:branched-chain amino acid transport system permease protein
VLVLAGIAVIWVRNGTTGRFLAAVRGSETAAASVGINATRARITAFALSAFLAALGGGLLASYKIQVSPLDYNANFGLFWVVIVVTLGPRTVEGAIQGAAGFVLFQEWVLPTALPWLINLLSPASDISAIPTGWQQIFFGLGAITYAKHPEGILEHNKLASLARVQRRIDRLRSRRSGVPPASAAPAGGTA